MASLKNPVKAASSSKEEKSADSVMGTNNSSIVSKRSVEMLYYPEPHFFRYFVKKPSRRTPLVNREYWLRMHAINESVRRFLREPSEKPKFVINLGCGFDPLPFILSAEGFVSSQTTFVDVDYEKLMVNKKTAIQKAQIIQDQLVGTVEFSSDESAVQIRSEQYIAVGCDLKNLEKLNHVLKTEVLPADCTILFLAEVALTYMDVKSANAVISWAAKLNDDVHFCILEHFLPDGPGHPFTTGIIKQYSKAGTPLHSIHEYPSLADQKRRFMEAGWIHVNARSLWDLWSDDNFVSSAQRKSLDSVEAFDEWEEFALFESHYFLLYASMRRGKLGLGLSPVSTQAPVNNCGDFRIIANCTSPTAQRRFGAVIPCGKGAVGLHAGWGPKTRLADTDLYTQLKDNIVSPAYLPPSADVSARLCHTITTLNDNGDCLLAGGRASPVSVFQDTWIRKDNAWQRGPHLPTPRFRHSATKVTLDSESVLIYGGRTGEGTTLDEWLLWSYDETGGKWQTVAVQTATGITRTPPARFGACLANITETGSTGVLFGGIGAGGTILEDFWTWELEKHTDSSVHLKMFDCTGSLRESSPGYDTLSRFGATITSIPRGLVVAGGIMARRLVPSGEGIFLLDSAAMLECIENGSTISKPVISTIGLGPDIDGPAPLLVGHAACAINPNKILFLGGGAVCFPSGTVWTEGTWTLVDAVDAEAMFENKWSLLPQEVESANSAVDKIEPAKKDRGKHNNCSKFTNNVTVIPRIQVRSPAEFQRILDDARPVIIERTDIGPCTELWTKEYLVNAVGNDRKVVVHEASSENMSFRSKNFTYTTKEFGTFMEEVHAGRRQYLRSISIDQPTRLPANLATDFPSLKNDFRLPEALQTVIENAHSSPLRVSGPVTLWLHYDVMANVLCQIQGEKRLILYPPTDVQHLDVPAGASSSNINVFKNRADESITFIPHTSPHEARLKRGDILFLPPLWLHTAAPTGDVSVAVNVFFRNLSQGYAAGRDVYGNRDVQAYEKGRKDLEKMAKTFAGLPPDMARFYLLRLADELQAIAEGA
ncbi:tRNA methyltransferase PPM2 [Aspergillus stella-maris]|uniref:tRNA methyltransferase PPM2 n=1 Tax=Aspergillus stella-maris TaxID=1810926 RepID=UPI003CCE3D21